MKPIKRPPQGFEWQQPGYSFQLGDWPPGFVSQIELDRSAALSASSTAARERQLAQGKAGFAEPCKLIAQYRENMMKRSG